MVDDSRVTQLKEGKEKHGPVVYWMSRDMRISDNWALLFAANLANQKSVPLAIAFTLAPTFGAANFRHYSFLLNVLEEVEKEAIAKGMGFNVMLGNPEQTIVEFLEKQNASVLVSDFDPLRIKRSWSNAVTNAIDVSHFQVDAHNVVPCRVASGKLEYGAYTLRPKISKLLPKYLTNFPDFPDLENKVRSKSTQWTSVLSWFAPDDSVKPIDWLKPG